jgi:hypothetical protein
MVPSGYSAEGTGDANYGCRQAVKVCLGYLLRGSAIAGLAMREGFGNGASAHDHLALFQYLKIPFRNRLIPYRSIVSFRQWIRAQLDVVY